MPLTSLALRSSPPDSSRSMSSDTTLDRSRKSNVDYRSRAGSRYLWRHQHQGLVEGRSNLLDGFHNRQILLPEAEGNGPLGCTSKALEQLDELPVLELQGRPAPPVLAEEMQRRRLEGVASERDAERSAEREEIVEGPVPSAGY